jgi:hypothetical protein
MPICACRLRVYHNLHSIGNAAGVKKARRIRWVRSVARMVRIRNALKKLVKSRREKTSCKSYEYTKEES